MTRHDGRKFDEMRETTIIPGYLKYPYGSVLISCGDTKVICAVQVEETVPEHVAAKNNNSGWLTAEYALMPASGLHRNRRAGYDGTMVKGRVHEIQRLIGRSMRAALDLKKIGPRTIMIDCDVLQADGGTRTASITGAMAALRIAVDKLMQEGKIKENPFMHEIAAVSVGVFKGEVLLDLDYFEDSKAETDLNLVMTKDGGFVEIQGTAENGSVYNEEQLDAMLKVAKSGIKKLFDLQEKALQEYKSTQK
ncbi:MAG: ribonuclease PH [Candidatus Riflebacteria bacterium]|nr:ribonuclease PH [Candidatus Riflebacteria bacterium]